MDAVTKDDLAYVIGQMEPPTFSALVTSETYDAACRVAADEMAASVAEHGGRFASVSDKKAILERLSIKAVSTRNRVVRERLGFPWMKYSCQH